MPTIISPKHTQEQFKGGMTLADKIDVYIESVRFWQLQPARRMIENVNWDFATMKVVTSYFEMIAKYRDGFAQVGKSGEYFKKGLSQVFSEIESWDEQARLVLLTWLYEKVRCGLYHAGMILSDVGLSRDFPAPVSFHRHVKTEVGISYTGVRTETSFTIIINVASLVAAIEADFEKYEQELRDDSKVDCRNKFETRFEFDRAVSPPVIT